MMTGATSGTRMMTSIMVTPVSAAAHNFSSGQVQFQATGTFSMSPMTAMSPAVLWSVGSPFAAPPMSGMPKSMMTSSASVDGNGVAQCNGFVGIVTIQATAPADPGMPLSQMTAMTNNVSGQAQLVCP